MPAKKWLEDEVSLAPIKNQTIAVIGYGIQGRAQASNMKDSGLNVIVGLRKGGKTWKQAEAESHKVMEVAEAAQAADIIHVLIPDMEQADTFTKEIGKHVTEGKALSFSHGGAIHWKWIVPPKNVDVIMVAPKGPGSAFVSSIRKDLVPHHLSLFIKIIQAKHGIGSLLWQRQ